MQRVIIVDRHATVTERLCVAEDSGPVPTRVSRPRVIRPWTSTPGWRPLLAGRVSADPGGSPGAAVRTRLPQGVLSGDDLYDLTVTDGDCRLRVTRDPVLNTLVERNVLHAGYRLSHASFSLPLRQGVGLGVQGSANQVESFRLVSVCVCV